MKLLEWILIFAGLAWMALYVVFALTRPDPKEQFMRELLAAEFAADNDPPEQASESRTAAHS